VDPVPDPLLLRKSGSAGDRTRDLCICSQKLWPLDHRGGRIIIKTHHLYFIRAESYCCGPRIETNPRNSLGQVGCSKWGVKILRSQRKNVSSVPVLNHRLIAHSTTLEIKKKNNCRWFQEYVAGRFLYPEGVVFSNEFLFMLNENLKGQNNIYWCSEVPLHF